MSSVVVGAVRSNSSSPPTIQNTSGTEIGQFCRAWVNFNGTGTVAIRAQFNVSSITDNGVGDYTINFSTAMPDANYCVCSTNGGDTGGSGWATPAIRSLSAIPTASAVRVGVLAYSNWSDAIYCTFAIFR